MEVNTKSLKIYPELSAFFSGTLLCYGTFEFVIMDNVTKEIK
jgi:hypothetical protein